MAIGLTSGATMMGDEPIMTNGPSMDRKIVYGPIQSDSGLIGCSCIKTARQQGVDIPIGTNAEDFEPNSKPEIGGLILLSYPKVDHVAVILSFEKEGFLVYEGNFKKCIQRERIIYYIDPFIRGFWTP